MFLILSLTPLNTFDITANGQSSISCKDTLVGSDSAFIVEWRNFGLNNYPASTRFSFQATFYRGTERIEFHYGPSSFTTGLPFPGPSPYITLLHATKGFGAYKEQVWVTDNPSAPNVTSSISNIDSFPANGTLYRFHRVDTTTTTTSLDENDFPNEVIIFPNPAQEKIIIQSKLKIKAIQLVNLEGKAVEVNHQTYEKEAIEVSISHLPKGVYTIIVNFDNGESLKRKIIKE